LKKFRAGNGILQDVGVIKGAIPLPSQGISTLHLRQQSPEHFRDTLMLAHIALEKSPSLKTLFILFQCKSSFYASASKFFLKALSSKGCN
jgi:hypothetical protein